MSLHAGYSLGLDPLEVQHTDELVGVLDWSEASDEVARWIRTPGPWVIEGVAAVRALRKAILAFPTEKPCEVLYLLERPWVPLGKGQETMAKGCATVWSEIAERVLRLGVTVRRTGAR